MDGSSVAVLTDKVPMPSGKLKLVMKSVHTRPLSKYGSGHLRPICFAEQGSWLRLSAMRSLHLSNHFVPDHKTYHITYLTCSPHIVITM